MLLSSSPMRLPTTPPLQRTLIRLGVSKSTLRNADLEPTLTEETTLSEAECEVAAEGTRAAQPAKQEVDIQKMAVAVDLRLVGEVEA